MAPMLQNEADQHNQAERDKADPEQVMGKTLIFARRAAWLRVCFSALEPGAADAPGFWRAVV